jgi:integrase
MAEMILIPTTSSALATPRERETNPAAVYLASLAPTGRYSTMRALDRIAAMMGYDWQTMPWAELRYKHVQAIRTKLAERLKPGTVNTMLCALRRVAQEAWRLGQIDAETYARIKDVPAVTGSTLPAGRAVGSGEMGAILDVCARDPSPAGVRDAAIIAVGYGGGLRRAELASLTLASIQDDDGDTITLKLVGKRHKERIVYLDNGGASALRDWLTVRGKEPGPLFYRGLKGGHLVPGAGMTPQAIRDVIVRRAQQAKVDNVTPHDLRRSFVSDLLDAGADIATVAKMAGHSNVQTTARYDRRPEAAKKRAARMIHVPYARRTLPKLD